MRVYLKFLILLQVIMAATSEEVNIATFEDVKNAPHNKICVIDVRQPEELAETGIIPGSINIPLAEVRNAFENLSEDEYKATFGHKKPELNDPIIFTCRIGRRSKVAYTIAKNLGYTNLKNFKGGWLYWEKMLNEKNLD